MAEQEIPQAESAEPESVLQGQVRAAREALLAGRSERARRVRDEAEREMRRARQESRPRTAWLEE